MKPVSLNTYLTLLVGCSILIFATPCASFAQHSGAFGISANPANNNAYFTSADHTVNTDISGGGFQHDVFVGKSDTASAGTNFVTQTPVTPVTLTVATGANIMYNGTFPTYPDGNQRVGVSVFGNNRLSVTGGYIGYGVDCWNNSSVSVSGGFVESIRLIGNGSVASISGGTVNFFSPSSSSSVINISGGTVQNGIAFVNSQQSTISGGSLLSGLAIQSNASVNFVGSNLSVTYNGSGSGMYGYADRFTVLGTFAGTPNQTYSVFINNSTGTPNAAPRRFTLNGAAPVVVPEAGTLVLLLPVISVFGVVVRRRAS